jgi:hypothetical protein
VSSRTTAEADGYSRFGAAAVAAPLGQSYLLSGFAVPERSGAVLDPEVVVLAEPLVPTAKAGPLISTLPDTDMDYFGPSGDRMPIMFNIRVNQSLFYALAAANSRPLERR